MVKKMHHNTDGLGGIYGLIVTVVFCFISRFTLSDWSSIATMLAAAATVVWYGYKIVTDYKRNKPPKK